MEAICDEEGRTPCQPATKPKLEPTQLTEYKRRDARAYSSTSPIRRWYMFLQRKSPLRSSGISKPATHLQYGIRDHDFNHFGYVKQCKDTEGHLMQILWALKL